MVTFVPKLPTVRSGRPHAQVLFLMGSPAHVRNFESILESLGKRGHTVDVLFEERKAGADEAGARFLDGLKAQHGAIRWELISRMRPGLRGRMRTVLEAAQDYLRYFDPPYSGTDRLRSRAVAFMPAGVERALSTLLGALPRLRRLLDAGASRAGRALGDPASVRRELRARRPDVVIATPLVQFRARQRSWVRVAGELGIGTIACAYSWDIFTNRGLMHCMPDRVAVWNDAQRAQAARLHGISEGSIVIAGAWPYDHWFGRRPSRSRDEFLEELGLSAERRTILYVCSSRFIADHERDAVEEWVRALRSAGDSRVATANVIVRPHPLNVEQWADGGQPDPGVVLFPAHPPDPLEESARADYYDSIAHADAVVGVNTSALLEATILDRPALAYPGPRFRSSQDDLPHFRLLVGEPRAVRASRSMEEHLAQLSEFLADPGADRSHRRRFVSEFIRPHGERLSAAERVVEVVEDLVRANGTRRAPASSRGRDRRAPGSSPRRP